MGEDDFLGDRQAEPGAFFVPAPREVGLVKAVENFTERLLRDADAGIFYGDEYFLSFFPRLDPDFGIGVAEFHGIVDEVIKNLVDFALVGIYDQFFFRIKIEYEGYALFRGSSLEGVHGLDDGLVNVEIFQVEKDAFAVKRIQFKQVGSEVRQAFGLGQNDVQVFFLHFIGNRAI